MIFILFCVWCCNMNVSFHTSVNKICIDFFFNLIIYVQTDQVVTIFYKLDDETLSLKIRRFYTMEVARVLQGNKTLLDYSCTLTIIFKHVFCFMYKTVLLHISQISAFSRLKASLTGIQRHNVKHKIKH